MITNVITDVDCLKLEHLCIIHFCDDVLYVNGMLMGSLFIFIFIFTGTKTLVVHGQNECDIPTQLPVHEDTQFEALLKVPQAPPPPPLPLDLNRH